MSWQMLTTPWGFSMQPLPNSIPSEPTPLVLRGSTPEALPYTRVLMYIYSLAMTGERGLLSYNMDDDSFTVYFPVEPNKDYREMGDLVGVEAIWARFRCSNGTVEGEV